MTVPRNKQDIEEIGIRYNASEVPTSVLTFREAYVDNMGLGANGHYGYPDFPAHRNVGGDFSIWGLRRNRPTVFNGIVGPSNKGNRYNGDILIADSAAGLPSVSTAKTGEVYGPVAYARMKPTKPLFQGLNAIYELREVPEMLRQRFTPDLMGAGNYWLALQFGWKPLLSDIRNVVQFQRRAQERLNWLIRRDGKPIRTNVTLVDTSTEPIITTGQDFSGFLPTLSTSWYVNGAPKWRRKQYTRERIWASARFRFWLPPRVNEIKWRRQMMAKLFGLTPTPSVIYNMIPWSWLVDWFSNTGDVLSNLDAGVASRLAADYFYVMRSLDNVKENEVEGSIMTPYGPTHLCGVATASTYSKWRAPGDPFGWGTSELSLSSMQLSILGALGLSRLR